MLNPRNLIIETLRPPNPGGQHTGMMCCGVKVTHAPTGLSATCAAERSQLKNRDVCFAMLEYGLAEIGVKDE